MLEFFDLYLNDSGGHKFYDSPASLAERSSSFSP